MKNQRTRSRGQLMSQVILVTGATSGFGRVTVESLARAGSTVYASMRDTVSRNKRNVAALAAFSKQNHADLRGIELDVQSEESVDRAIARVISDAGQLDVLVHKADHMVFGPAEAFTAEQYAELYDVNVLGSHRVNRAKPLPLAAANAPTALARK